MNGFKRGEHNRSEVKEKVKTLFITAPDLVEGFKMFMPESAAWKEAQGPINAQTLESTVYNGADSSKAQLIQTKEAVQHPTSVSPSVKSAVTTRPTL